MRTAVIAGAFLLLLGRGPAAASEPDLTGIDKYRRIDDKVSTAAQPTVPQLELVRAAGFRTVVNLREPSEHDAAAEENALRELGLKYVSIPVRTADPKDEQVDAFLKILDDPAVFPVLLHCGSGNRAGAFFLIRRVLVDGWSIADATREAKEIGMKSANLEEFALAYIRGHAVRPR